MKRCSKCFIEKDLDTSNFSRKNSGKDGFDSYCKDCKKESDQKRYQAKREEILNQKKEYYAKKRDRESITNKI